MVPSFVAEHGKVKRGGGGIYFSQLEDLLFRVAGSCTRNYPGVNIL